MENKTNTSTNTNVSGKWQASKQTLKERFSFLFNNEIFSDIYFVVGKENQRRIPAHKFVLIVSSDIFETMFCGSLPTNSSEILLPDVESPAFLAFLKFIYSDEVQIDQETVMSTIYLAKKYNVPVLKTHCVAFLENHLDCDNAILLLTQARFFDELHLANLCLNYIDRHATNALSAKDVVDMDLDTLIAVLKRDKLVIEESVLYQAVLRWAQAECTRKQLDLTPENQRSVLGGAFKLIRFPLMSIEEFGVGPVQSNLLTDSELRELILYFTVKPKPLVEFSDVPRRCLNDILQLVNRFPNWSYSWSCDGTREDSICFMVDHPIVIVGFGFCGTSQKAIAKYDIDLQLIQTDNNKVCGSIKTLVTWDRSSNCQTYQVRFKQFVEILPNTLYTASAVIKGPKSLFGINGQRKVTLTSSLNLIPINFQFSSSGVGDTNVERGQIAEILFYT